MSKKDSSKPFVKIAHAARVLGVHKDTLRRWEKAGKIQVKRDQKGTRLYDISDLVKIIPADEPSTASPVKISYPPTADLLKSAQIHLQNIFMPPRRPPGGLNLVSEDNKRINKNWHLLAGFCIFVFLSIVGVALYLRATHIPYSKPTTQQKTLLESEVLGETTAQATVKINANEKVSGSLVVDSDINGMKLAVSPVSGEGFSISANEATINARGAVTLNQDLSTTASPTFAGLTVKSPIKAPSLGGATLNLTGSSNQVVFNYESSSKGTLTWTPTAARTITLPDATDTLVGKATTDTLSNKTIKSGDSNTISGSFTGITGLGTITTGTWNATKIATGYGGTNLTSYTTGDILYASATDTLSKLTVGSSGQVLTLSSGIPAWSTVSATGVTADSLDFSEFKDSMTLDATTNIATAGYNLTTSGSGAISFNNTGNVGIGTSAAGSTLAVNGNEVIGWGTTSIAGPTNGLAVFGNLGIGTTSPSVMLDVRGSTTIAPTSSGVALRVNAAPSGSNNILEVLNTAGTSTYFSIDSSGQLSGSAFQITDANNAIVGTAIAGGWTMNSNTFTYRRIITITNSSGSTLPKYYEISIAMNNSDSNQTYGKSQQSSPYKDFRTAWYNDGGTITEIARNVSSFTSSDITFSFQLSANISNGSSDTYYIYYGNSALSSTPSTYTGNTQLDSADSVSNWSSGDDGYTLSQETTIKQEGTGSVKAVAAIGNLGTGSIASQGQLLQTLTGLSVVKATISSTDYAYALGGNNGTSDQTTVYKSTLSSGNLGTFSTTSQGQLPQGLSGHAVVPAVTAFDGGTGADGTLDLSLGSGAGGCNGTGLSWAGSTCTIATATKSTFNFTTINVSSGTTLTTSGTTLPTLKATGNVTIAGTIDLAGKGYSANNGSGAGGSGGNCGGAWRGGGGAGFGGAGGNGSNAGNGCGLGGITYDTTDVGSGGGTSFSATGGNGGGGIKIISTGNITGSGSISANGNVGGNYDFAAGGGSGGKIWLQASIINLTGTISANGGNGGNSPGCGGGCGSGGGGGGGRITLEYTTSVTASTSVTGGNAGEGFGGNYGSAGSVGVSTQTLSVPNAYVLGGINGTTAQSTVYKSSISGSDLGTFSTTSQTQLPQALYGHSASTFSISNTNYIYVIGGYNTSAQTTVYKSTIDSSGNVGAFSTTSQTQLSSALYQHGSTTATIGGTNYIYILGGLNSSGTAQTTVYKATVDGSANVSAITSTGQSALPQALSQLQAVVVTTGSDNYIYAIGGKNSSGNAVSTVYKAALDSSGNVGSWSSTGQSALPQTLYGHGAFTASSGGVNYVYILGGQNTAVRDTVYKAQVNDMSSYTATKTLSSTNLSNKNDLQWKYYSSATGSYMALEFSEDGSTWQTCSFSVSSASTWETKTCDISGIASASRDAVTKVRFRVTSNQTSAVTSYFDDIQGLMNATTITNTTSYGRSILGASNLAVNAQGTGLVTVNYAASPAAAAGSGGFAVYDGTITALFTVGGSGNVGIGTTGPARLNIIGTGTSTALTLLTQGSGSGATFGLAVLDSGNIGIGTTNPLGKLVVLGGNVGIGTSSPNATLSIQGNVGIGYTGLNQAIPSNGLAVSGNVGIGTTTANSNLSIAGNVHIGSVRQGISAPTDGLLVDGNVGIGATTSSNKLDVWGNSRLAGTLTVDGNGTIGGTLGVTGATTLSSTLAVSGVTTLSANNGALAFTGTTPSITSGGSVLGLFAGGNVGIGTTGNLYGGLTVRGAGTGTNITLQTYGSNLTQGLTVLDNGNVGIGTTGPSSKLNIIGNVGIGTSSAGANLAVNGNAIIGWGTTSTAGPASGLAVFGNVGIGTTSPTELLQIQGPGSMPSLLVTSSGNVGIGTSVTANPLTVGIDGSSGNGAYLTTGGVWTNGSSIEFKENFVSLNDAEILDKINQLPILQWNYKLEDPSIRHIGPMAEDFNAIFGVGNDSKHISTIDPSGVALAGIKAQQKELSAISLQLSDLNKQIASASAILANLTVSDDGTLNVPKLKAGSITLDSDLDSRKLKVEDGALKVEDGGWNEASPSSILNPQNTTVNSLSSTVYYYDLTGKIASLEDRIAALEAAANTSKVGPDSFEVNIAGEATASASVILANEVSPESTPSASDSGVVAHAPPQNDTSLNLTPPDILLASNTSKVSFGSFEVSEATISGMLTAYSAQIQDNFKVLGQTTLGKTLIAGDLTIDGTLSLTGSSLSTLGTLHIQNSLLAGDVDFFNGLVTITSDGQITAQKIKSDKLILGEEILGSNVIKADTNEVVVETPVVSEKSRIFVTAQTEIDTVLFVTDKIIGQSFKVKTKVPALSDIIFDWSILDSP